MEAKECDCKDWRENIDKLNAGFECMRVHTGWDDGYQGKFIEYCPWCGKKLQEQNNEGGE